MTAAAVTPTPVNNESAGAEGAEFITQDLSRDPPGNDDLLLLSHGHLSGRRQLAGGLLTLVWLASLCSGSTRSDHDGHREANTWRVDKKLANVDAIG